SSTMRMISRVVVSMVALLWTGEPSRGSLTAISGLKDVNWAASESTQVAMSRFLASALCRGVSTLALEKGQHDQHPAGGQCEGRRTLQRAAGLKRAFVEHSLRPVDVPFTAAPSTRARRRSTEKPSSRHALP